MDGVYDVEPQDQLDATKCFWHIQSRTISPIASLLESAISAWLFPVIPREGKSIHCASTPAATSASYQRRTLGTDATQKGCLSR